MSIFCLLSSIYLIKMGYIMLVPFYIIACCSFSCTYCDVNNVEHWEVKLLKKLLTK